MLELIAPGDGQGILFGARLDDCRCTDSLSTAGVETRRETWRRDQGRGKLTAGTRLVSASSASCVRWWMESNRASGFVRNIRRPDMADVDTEH